ncbi:nuclear transport factor 2 family protein [Microbacterium sp. LRZ72]|uniref:nuclear transport factor 2 family protein n=1 Tax=Microbacterium sp. LRZ72 TaxID=2942481 RepID=UPI0029B8BC66|nr:nuclear transport factor 2 family protein [Microbacterium sp. LRZ72]MDX2377858.1 nuclear transport factor 2 family protein [Microbacterium sp. LRZ72]
MHPLTVENLLALERAGWDSLCTSTGANFYGDLMTADAVMILVNGMVLDRATVAASLDESPPWSGYDLTDVRLVPIDDATAALLYRATATRDGDEHPFVARMASTYTVVAGEPRLVLYQQTTVTH